MESMGILGFFFGLVAFAYAHKSKADIAKLEQDIEGLKAMLEKIQMDKS
ncbi:MULTISPECIES: hypothetical protein [unclassified Marinomonas]|nr:MULTISPECIES: hypothetical protein [unclassified Marinomonas]